MRTTGVKFGGRVKFRGLPQINEMKAKEKKNLS